MTVAVRRAIGAAVVAAALGAAMVVAPTPAWADETPPTFVTSWGSQGPAAGQFQYPWGIAVDSTGNVFVADRDNHRVQKFSATGTYLTQWGTYGTDPGQFRNPYGLAMSADDRLYVVDTAGDRIQVFTTDGLFLDEWGSNGTGPGQFSSPQGVAIAPDGTVYVSDGANNRIQHFTADGTFLRQWPPPGTGSGNQQGRFDYPRDVAVGPDGDVFVVDTRNNRVQRFGPLGTFEQVWGGYGSLPGQLRYPYAIRVDSAGSVFVADYDNQRVQQYTSNGAFVQEWGSEGSGPGQFRHPQGLGLDAAGNIYVSDSDNHRVQKFSTAATPGTVAGTVTESGTGDPVAGAMVAVLRTADFSFAGSAVTDGSGGYSTPAAPGSYFVYVVDPSGYRRSGFHGAPATVAVSSGAVTDVDPALLPYRGRIAGTVRDASTAAPVPGAWALALSTVDGAVEAGTVASGSGAYALPGVAPGNHFVAWIDPTGQHATRFSPTSPALPGATPLAVTAGATTVADGSLASVAATGTGAALSGTVVEAGTSAPLAGVHVVALRVADFGLARGAVTDSSGNYSLDLAAGRYLVAFVDPSAEHATEWFDDRPATTMATATQVDAPGTANVALTPTRGATTGTVTDEATGDPLEGAWVLAIGPAGLGGGAVTAADGTYAIDGLVPGTYRMTFVDPSGVRAQEFWDDSADLAGATAFPVAAGAILTRSAALG